MTQKRGTGSHEADRGKEACWDLNLTRSFQAIQQQEVSHLQLSLAACKEITIYVSDAYRLLFAIARRSHLFICGINGRFCVNKRHLGYIHFTLKNKV